MINTDKPTRREIKLYMLERFRSMDNARELQAIEYERRLSLLNHNWEHLNHQQTKYIPREVYEREVAATEQRVTTEVNNINEKREMVYKELSGRIDVLINWKASIDGQSELTKYIPWILTAISIALMYFTRPK